MPPVVLRIAGVYDDRCHSILLAHQIQRIYERWLTSHVYGRGTGTAGAAPPEIPLGWECNASAWGQRLPIVGTAPVGAYRASKCSHKDEPDERRDLPPGPSPARLERGGRRPG